VLQKGVGTFFLQEFVSMEMKLSDDLMVGAKPIAEWLGLPVRQVFYLAEMGRLPLFKMGKLWAGRKSTLKQHIETLERGGCGKVA
jgi:hypothetical protein